MPWSVFFVHPGGLRWRLFLEHVSGVRLLVGINVDSLIADYQKRNCFSTGLKTRPRPNCNPRGYVRLGDYRRLVKGAPKPVFYQGGEILLQRPFDDVGRWAFTLKPASGQ